MSDNDIKNEQQTRGDLEEEISRLKEKITELEQKSTHSYDTEQVQKVWKVNDLTKRQVKMFKKDFMRNTEAYLNGERVFDFDKFL